MLGALGGVDLNTASREALDLIGLIGRDHIEQIIRERPFRDWDDFKQRVPGISDKLVQDLQQAGVKIGGARAETGGGGA